MSIFLTDEERLRRSDTILLHERKMNGSLRFRSEEVGHCASIVDHGQAIEGRTFGEYIMFKKTLIAGLIATMSVSVLFGTTNISNAGAKNTETSNYIKYSKVSNNTKKTRGQDPFSKNWGDRCNDFGPPGSINFHGHGAPKGCFPSSDTFNPFEGTIYD